MIYETFSSNNQRKRALRELGQVHQVTAAHSWTDTPRARPMRAPAAQVLNPIVDGFRLTKVLMDGGSGLNLIYKDTNDKMLFDISRIKQSYTTFRGIISGREARCSR